MRPSCWMKRDGPLKIRQCCCKCKYHLPDYSHPHTDGHSVTHRRGYVCNPPEWKGVHSGWPNHSIGCEMFTRTSSKRRRKG